MRVVFVVLDGMPARHVGREVTPRLWALAGEGARFAVGRSVMTSATYPNHATFATGAGPDELAAFEASGERDAAVSLRRADDEAKVVGLRVPGLDRWEPVLRAVAGDHAGST